MNKKIKTQDTEPNKVIVDLTNNFLNDLYEKCGIDLDHNTESNMEGSYNQDREKDN